MLSATHPRTGQSCFAVLGRVVRAPWEVLDATQVLEQAESETGGFKLASASIAGRAVYGQLKFESGVHRVQRVPATESSGRVHTSAASVAVMPQADGVDPFPYPNLATASSFDSPRAFKRLFTYGSLPLCAPLSTGSRFPLLQQGRSVSL